MGGLPLLFLPDGGGEPLPVVEFSEFFVCILCLIWSAISLFFILSMWTLSGGGVDAELLEATGLEGDRLLGEVEGVLLDSVFGDGEDC